MPKFQRIEEGLEALKKGGLVLVTDDPDRENEGDLICAAPVCHYRECKLYGYLWERTDLYADDGGICEKASDPSDGVSEYR